MSTVQRIAVLTASFGLTSALVGCGEKPVPLQAAAAPFIPEVQCITVRAGSRQSLLELPGNVTAVRAATLTAPVAGEVRAVADEGGTVAAGQQIALLEPLGLAAQVSAARSAANAAVERRESSRTGARQAAVEREVSIQTLEQALKVAEADRDRKKAALAEAESRSSTEPARLRSELEGAEAKVRFLKSGEREQRLRQLEAEQKVAATEVQVAKSQLQRTRTLFAQGLVSKAEVEIAELTLQRARATEVQEREELRLAREGAHPEQIRQAEHEVESARQALRAAEAMKEQAAQARAEVSAAEAELEKARQALENARKNRLALVRAEQEARASLAESQRYQAELDDARQRLEKATVKAPFAGQVVRRYARVGETVAAGANLVDVVDPNQLHFEASLSPQEMVGIRSGAPVTVQVSGLPTALPGRIRDVILAADPAKRSYKVTVQLSRTTGLRPGMVGTARLSAPATGEGTRLPLACLRRHFPRESRGEVFVVEGGRLAVRTVTLGVGSGSTVTVLAGLDEGVQVVVSEPRMLEPGGEVRVRETEAL